ncbi:hypothetical protein MTO96_030586 [Rhipicephalus appendiculatus]
MILVSRWHHHGIRYSEPFAIHCLAGRTSHCYVCRSRSQLGDCRDPFPYNETTVEGVRGVEASPCASKWCGKLVEGRDDGEGYLLCRGSLSQG